MSAPRLRYVSFAGVSDHLSQREGSNALGVAASCRELSFPVAKRDGRVRQRLAD